MHTFQSTRIYTHTFFNPIKSSITRNREEKGESWTNEPRNIGAS